MHDTPRKDAPMWWLVGYCSLAASLVVFAITRRVWYP